MRATAFHRTAKRVRPKHDRAAARPRRSPGRDPGALRGPLAGAGVRRAAPRLPPAVRLLSHRRPADAARRRRAPRRRPGLRRRLGRGPAADDRRQAGASEGAGCALPVHGDRVRELPAPHRARRGSRSEPRGRDVRARDAEARPAGDHVMSEPEYQVLVSAEEQAHAEELGEELPATLPVLPLKETVVFPESMTPLAIGQERSIQLIDDVVGGDRLLVLVTVRDTEADVPTFDDLYEVGTAAIVHKMIRVPDGTLRILVQGLRRVRLERRVLEEPYLVAEFLELPDLLEETKEVEALTRNVQGLFAQ